MSKIKLTDKEVDKLACLVTRDGTIEEVTEEDCRKIAKKYIQARKLLSEMNGEKIKGKD